MFVSEPNICFTQIEDMNAQTQLSAAHHLASGGGGAAPLEESGADGDEDDDNIPDLEAPEDDGPVDETGVDPKDIDLVMAQVFAFEHRLFSRAKLLC